MAVRREVEGGRVRGVLTSEATAPRSLVRLLAFACGAIVANLYYAQPLLHAIAPEERGQGIGTRLLDAVDTELERLGIGDLFIAALVGNEGAVRLYERRGLRPVMTYLARFAAGDQRG